MPDYNQKLEDLLDHYLIANQELIKRKELGGVGYLLNGNMCLGIYEDYLVARVGKSLADTIINQPGIKPYLPENSNFEEFILVSEGIYTHQKAFRKFVNQSMEYTASLPPNEHDSQQL